MSAGAPGRQLELRESPAEHAERVIDERVQLFGLLGKPAEDPLFVGLELGNMLA
jgi:hypothetical protein